MAAMIDQATKDALREILLSGEEVWAGKLDELIASYGSDPVQAVRIKQFLRDRTPTAKTEHAPRLEAMFDRIGSAIRKIDPHNHVVDILAERVRMLNGKRQEVDSELTETKQLLIALVGERGIARGERFRVKTSGSGWSLRILDKQMIADRWTSPQPDRQAILQHFKNTGEIIPGASVSARQPNVYLNEIEDVDVDGLESETDDF